MRAVMVREWTEFENLKLEHDVPTQHVGTQQVRTRGCGTTQPYSVHTAPCSRSSPSRLRSWAAFTPTFK